MSYLHSLEKRSVSEAPQSKYLAHHFGCPFEIGIKRLCALCDAHHKPNIKTAAVPLDVCREIPKLHQVSNITLNGPR